MASVHEYKRLENRFVQRVKNDAKNVVKFFNEVLDSFVRFLTRRYTVVFVPHSEKKVYNLHVTVLSICCFLLVVAGILGAFLFYGASHSSTVISMAEKDGNLRNAQASVDQFRDEANALIKEARNFENTLVNVLSSLGIGNNNTLSQNSAGDLSSIIGIDETPQGILREIQDIRRLTVFLSQVDEPIKELGDTLNSQIALFTEIPSIWPVRNGAGFISMFFGQNIHPIHGQYYIHRGIDIATGRFGDPIVSSADGTVVTAEFSYDYGNYVIIRHRHGFYTRYAHLQNFIVQVGQRVQQNEVIGYMGSTGISTGPHLHYEVHIGSDVVDPFRYITIRSSLARQGR
ncbi:MAG: M23 family metallopeptidase [Treponema sp.]|nr:M23 family metallopeptidase [Treponema sp.]